MQNRLSTSKLTPLSYTTNPVVKTRLLIHEWQTCYPVFLDCKSGGGIWAPERWVCVLPRLCNSLCWVTPKSCCKQWWILFVRWLSISSQQTLCSPIIYPWLPCVGKSCWWFVWPFWSKKTIEDVEHQFYWPTLKKKFFFRKSLLYEPLKSPPIQYTHVTIS